MRPRFCSLQSKEGKSPLHMAAIHGRFTRSQILIQNGEWLLLQPRATPPPYPVVLSTCLHLGVCSEGLRAL